MKKLKEDFYNQRNDEPYSKFNPPRMSFPQNQTGAMRAPGTMVKADATAPYYIKYLSTLDEMLNEKLKGLDGKACWKGYKLSGTKKKGGKTVDNCIPMEENQKSPKFKIGDFVQPKDRDKYIGQIEDVYVNKPENIEMKDGEYVYSVDKLNHRGRNAMSFDFKESDLESISDPTEYIKGLQPYRRRN